MKRLLLVILIIAGLLVQACTVESIYSTMNDRWGLKLPKAVTIMDGASNSGTKLTSSTENMDFIFRYQDTDQATLDGLEIWHKLTAREINQLVKLLYPYFYPENNAPLTPAERLSLVEDSLGFAVTENLSYYSKRDNQGTTGGRIILLYDSDSLQIHAFHLVEQSP